MTTTDIATKPAYTPEFDEHWLPRYLDPELPVVMRATDVLNNLIHYRIRQIAESGDRAVIEAILESHDRLRAVNADLVAALESLAAWATELTEATDARAVELIAVEHHRNHLLPAARAAIAKATGGVA